MRIYRCISAKELTYKYKGIEKTPAIIQGENTHNYEENISYYHFFRYSQSAEFYLKKHQLFKINSQDHYIAYMIANIPKDIIEKYSGYGFYTYQDKPFANETIPLPEYAIPKELIKPEYILEINTYIPYEYQSNQEEYDNYLALLADLAKQYDHNFYKIVSTLQKQKLEKLLNITVDDRSESQINDDKIKQLCKIWQSFD